MNKPIVRLVVLAALAACGGGSTGSASGADTTAAQTAQVGDPCGGSPSAAACDESQNLYCQVQDPEDVSGGTGVCASCADLGDVTLVCSDGTIQEAQWVASSQTCEIVGCGETAPAGDDGGSPATGDDAGNGGETGSPQQDDGAADGGIGDDGGNTADSGDGGDDADDGG